MTPFVLLAAVLLVAVVAALLLPLMKPNAQSSVGMNAATIEAYRDQLEELEAQMADDGADLVRLEQERRALKLRLAAETRESESQVAAAPGARKAAIGLVVAAPVLAAFAYAWIGNPGAINPPAAKPGEHRLTRQDVEQMVEKLTARLKDAPGDVDSWILLARSQTSLGNFEQAARAYDAAAGFAPNNAGILADYADVVAMRQGKNFAGEPDQLIARALAADPRHTKSLALAGSSAFARKDFSAARDYWNRAFATLPPDSPPARSLRSSIAQAEAALSAGGSAPAAATSTARISGRVEIEASLAARVQPGDTLFVFARAVDGPRVPLAVARMTAAKLPVEFVLDDSMAMNPQMRLSSVRQVQIEAKISRSGSATPVSGDLVGALGPVAVGASGIRVQIREERR